MWFVSNAHPELDYTGFVWLFDEELLQGQWEHPDGAELLPVIFKQLYLDRMEEWTNYDEQWQAFNDELVVMLKANDFQIYY